MSSPVGTSMDTNLTQGKTGYYEVALGKRAVYVRVYGLATMNNCLCVRDFIDDMLRSDHHFVIVDLANCTGMDSTFMGVLASAATFDRTQPEPAVAVVNASAALKGLLDSVGISELVFIDEQPFACPEIDFLRLEDKASEEERLACVRDAHKRLVAVSEENEKVFGPFLTLLETEMRQKGML